MKVHFVGVWDTVSSVGLVKEDVFLSSSSSTQHARHFRHALALDERRVKFLSEYFYEMNTVTDTKKADRPQRQKSKYFPNEKRTATHVSSNIKEVWFAGSHSDVFVSVPSFRDSLLIPLSQAVEKINLESLSTQATFHSCGCATRLLNVA
ncbi:hypothetical protein BDN67DRAFT_737144 [Paxillus ammoniavirescens]|nr:hypothetical protein BDN67DRAFT_737144 [Paxillus ammoniavirescens]